MPAPFSDFLMQPVAGVMTPWIGVWVRLVSNNTGTAYVASAATDTKGKFTFTTIPGDNYTVYTGPTSSGAWTGTGDTSYAVPYVAGDDIVGKSFTGVASSPYASKAQAGSLAIGGPEPWYDAVANGVPTDGVSDCYAAVTALIAAIPSQATIYFPAFTYLFSQSVVVNKPIVLKGHLNVGKPSGSGVPYGTIFRPTNAAAQTALGANGLVKISQAGARAENIAIQGYGYTNGGYGFQFLAPSHGAPCHYLYCDQMGSGAVLGSGSDHVTFYDSFFSGNNYGIRIAVGFGSDLAIIDSLLDGNVTASLYLEANASVTNTLLFRTHLGFCQKGIYQDSATNTNNGFDGLTLIDSPIESVSVQHMDLNYGSHGNIHTIGGYWHWNGTPANPCVAVKNIAYGPIVLENDFNANSPNASSPAIINCSGVNSFGRVIHQDKQGFANAYFAGNAVGANAGQIYFDWSPTQKLIGGNSSNPLIELKDTGAGVGANLKLTGDGGVTPSKSIRARAGLLEILNSAYGAVIYQMDDGGNLTIVGTIIQNSGANFTLGGHFIAVAPGGGPATSALGANVTSVTFTGNDRRGTIAIVMAGALARNTRIATCTFATSYGATSPQCFFFNQTSGNLALVNLFKQASATGVSIDIASDQALATGTYTFGYIIEG